VAGPYFQKTTWPEFVYQNEKYSFSHLREYELSVEDSSGVVRIIAVTFSDHCFTRGREPGDDLDLTYKGSDGRSFCFERYKLTFDLVKHIENAVASLVWNVDGDNFAVVPAVTQSGQRILYGIVFSLDPVKGLPVKLHMRVKSAYPVDKKPLITYGFIRFRYLITVRMQNRRPTRNLSKHRKRPT